MPGKAALVAGRGVKRRARVGRATISEARIATPKRSKSLRANRITTRRIKIRLRKRRAHPRNVNRPTAVGARLNQANRFAGSGIVAGDHVDARGRCHAVTRLDELPRHINVGAIAFAGKNVLNARTKPRDGNPPSNHVGGSTTRMCSSFSCAGSTLLGASVIWSVPFCVLGNGITSRRL